MLYDIFDNALLKDEQIGKTKSKKGEKAKAKQGGLASGAGGRQSAFHGETTKMLNLPEAYAAKLGFSITSELLRRTEITGEATGAGYEYGKNGITPFIKRAYDSLTGHELVNSGDVSLSKSGANSAPLSTATSE